MLDLRPWSDRAAADIFVSQSGEHQLILTDRERAQRDGIDAILKPNAVLTKCWLYKIRCDALAGELC